MRGALVIALCATGCFSDRGVSIEVDIGETNATLVELFIGNQKCDRSHPPKGMSCFGIRPEGVTTLLPGNISFRDAASDGLLQVKGRTVTLQLKSDPTTTLPIVIAVGFDQNMQPVGTATLTDLEVPSNSARIVTTTLVDTKSSGSTDRVIVWPDPSSTASSTTPPNSCVAVQHTSQDWQFVVPLTDPDCDGLATGDRQECNANAYLDTTMGGLASTPNCFGVGQLGTCLLGSFPCMDGHGPTSGTCIPQNSQQDQAPVCVPSQFCNLSGCTGFDDLNCLENQIAQTPRIQCQVPTNSEGGPCMNQNFTTISLDSFYAPTERCDQPLLGGFQFVSLPTDPTHTFGIGNNVMGLDSPQARCSVTLTWKSGARTPTDPDEYGVIQLRTGDRITLLPIVFHFLAPGSCTTPGAFMCPPQGTLDSLLTCAHP